MKTVVDLMSVENPVFTTFIAWACMLVIKVRIQQKIFSKKKEYNLFSINFIFIILSACPDDAASAGNRLIALPNWGKTQILLSFIRFNIKYTELKEFNP